MTRTTQRTLKTIGLLLANKLSLWTITAALYLAYLLIPSGTPFLSAIYAVLVVFSIPSLMPVIRLLLFLEAAEFAEGKGLRLELDRREMSVIYRHYRFATAVSFLAACLPFVCIAAK
jgi:hypothetical protein